MYEENIVVWLERISELLSLDRKSVAILRHKVIYRPDTGGGQARVRPGPRLNAQTLGYNTSSLCIQVHQYHHKLNTEYQQKKTNIIYHYVGIGNPWV